MPTKAPLAGERHGSSRQPPNQPKFEVVAYIAGRGFGVRREDMKKLLIATRGKVFTLPEHAATHRPHPPATVPEQVGRGKDNAMKITNFQLKDYKVIHDTP